MAIEIGTQARSVSFKYDTSIITGDHVTVFAKNPASDAEPAEKKTVPNDGTFALAFPMSYSGEVFIEIHGSDEGEDTGTLAIGDAPEGVPEGEVEGDPPVEEAPVEEAPPAE